MSTNKTPNYQLHSWMPADEFHVSEINENFEKLDSKLARLEALDAAKVRAVAGSYRGTGQVWSVELGCKPIAVHVEHREGIRYPNTNFVCGGLAVRDRDLYEDLHITDTGFTFLKGAMDGVNMSSVTFSYLAILPAEEEE